VRVEAEKGGDRDDLGRRAEERVRDTIGLTVQVTVLDPGTLPRSEGKAHRVVDLRDLR
jgi:phenylacetate-CoA ligase